MVVQWNIHTGDNGESDNGESFPTGQNPDGTADGNARSARFNALPMSPGQCRQIATCPSAVSTNYINNINTPAGHGGLALDFFSAPKVRVAARFLINTKMTSRGTAAQTCGYITPRSQFRAGWRQIIGASPTGSIFRRGWQGNGTFYRSAAWFRQANPGCIL